MSSLVPKKSRPESEPATRDHSGSRAKRRQRLGLKHILTFAVAATADGLQFAFPPLWIPVSIITALILFSIWGWRWEILCVLVPELAPVVGILPSWVAIAIYLTARDGAVASENSLR